MPQQQNDYDCGLFVLYYMQRFIQEAPERFRKKDYSMVSQHCAVSLFLFADRYDMDDGCVCLTSVTTLFLLVWQTVVQT